MNQLSSQIIVNIINHEMCMPPNSVWLRDQNRLIPNDNGLYIVVGIVSAFTVANNVYMVEETVDMITAEHQINEVVQQENIQIDVLSRSNDALIRNWEVIAAMQSFYAQQQQEANQFKIFRIPHSFLDTSSAEGGSTLNRYTIVMPCMVLYRKDRVLSLPSGDYYDDFTQRVDDAHTIGTDDPMVEFEITADTPAPPYPTVS